MANQEERAEIAASLGRAMVDLQAAIDAEDQALADHLAIHRTDLRALDLVFRHGPLPAGRLAGMLGLTPGSVTALVDRLVKIDYVCRQPRIESIVFGASSRGNIRQTKALIDELSLRVLA